MDTNFEKLYVVERFADGHSINDTEETSIADVIAALAVVKAKSMMLCVDISNQLEFGYNTTHYYVGMTSDEMSKLIMGEQSEFSPHGIYADIKIKSDEGTLHIFMIKTCDDRRSIRLSEELVAICEISGCLKGANYRQPFE